mgnify:CR=1 FL=1
MPEIAKAHKTLTSYPLSFLQLKTWGHTNDILDGRDMYTDTRRLEDNKGNYFILALFFYG